MNSALVGWVGSGGRSWARAGSPEDKTSGRTFLGKKIPKSESWCLWWTWKGRCVLTFEDPLYPAEGALCSGASVLEKGAHRQASHSLVSTVGAVTGGGLQWRLACGQEAACGLWCVWWDICPQVWDGRPQEPWPWLRHLEQHLLLACVLVVSRETEPIEISGEIYDENWRLRSPMTCHLQAGAPRKAGGNQELWCLGAGEDGWPRSGREREFPLPLLFCSSWALSGLDGARWHWWGASSFLSPLAQMLISPGNTLTDTPETIFYQHLGIP